MKKVFFLLVGVVIIAGILAGCGQTAKRRDTRRLVKVKISGFAFKPETVTVRPNDIIDWENDDGPAHSVNADDGSWQSEPLFTDQHYEKSFKKPGTYPYHCKFHPEAMKGEIIVE